MNPHARAQEVVDVARALDAAGLMPNKSGNVSVRTERGFLITPAAVPYRELLVQSLVELGDTPNFPPPDANRPESLGQKNVPPASGAAVDVALHTPADPRTSTSKSGVSPFSPSSEWRMHAAIYGAYAEVGAIVHTHSPKATALACAGLGLPPFHYMIALAGGEVRCMPYATFGTAELAAHAVAGLAGRRATLLSNHGVIATGPTLKVAQAVALEVENLAGQYLALKAAGLEPRLLDADELARVVGKFAGYGRLG